MRTVTAILSLCLAAGCNVGEGMGALAGTIYVQQCLRGDGLAQAPGARYDLPQPYGALGAPASYDMRPTFFVADLIDDFGWVDPLNRVTIRVQDTSKRVEEADSLFLSIASSRLVAEQLGQPIVVGPASNVRATLQLSLTCPVHEVAMELDGTITFSSFGAAAAGAVPADFRIAPGDQLSASFGFDLVDRRALTLGGFGAVPAQPALSGRLDGSFDFEVRVAPAAQTL